MSHRTALLCSMLALAAASLATRANAGIVTSAGVTLAQQGPVGSPVPDNLALVLNGGSAFSDGALQPAGQHDTPKLNDGNYGNAFSWISDGDADGWAGISFGVSQTLEAIAFGRDNLGAFGDRTLGTYTLQYRNDGVVDDLGWSDIGTMTYAPGSGLVINPSHTSSLLSVRHGFNFAAVNATAVRLVVPNGAADTAIDEIELYSSALTPTPPPVVFGTIAWNGNDGDHFDGPVPNNLALASNGSTAFSDGDLGFGGHTTANLNNGQYGNSQSWISSQDAVNFAGIDLPGDGLYNLTSIAFGRDNQDAGDNFAAIDGNRALGTYTLQFTLLSDADASTANTGDPLTGWADIGILDYASNLDNAIGGDFSAHLRHEFEIGAIGGGPLQARGIRLLLSNADIAIDEIEIYGSVVPEPSCFVLGGLGLAGLARLRRRR